MEGVKLQNTVQVKTGTKSTTAAKSAAQDDGFVKLLQEKKDMAEPKKAEADKVPDKTSEGKKNEDSAPEKTGEKAEKPDESGEEKVPAGDGMEEDVLVQAMIQQAAAQMAGILPEAEQPVEEMTEEGADEVLNPVESLITEGQTGDTGLVQVQQESKARPVPQETESRGEDTFTQEESRSQGNMDISRQSVSHESDGVKESSTEPAVPTAKSSQPSVREERKAESAEETAPQQSLYHEGSVKEEPRQISVEGKVQEVPLKTTRADLPQDLGKTLAARLPKSGGELTIELEPAALGKLTIRLVYEGERAAVSILSSNPRTLELLNQRAAEIASILEEKTGEETIVYTQPAEQQEEQDPNRNPGGHSSQQGQEEQHENRRDDQHQTESFAQQLRLGLV